MDYHTIVFDLDGTISDPFEGISRSVNFALESSGYQTVDPESVRRLIGPPLTEIFEDLLGQVDGDRMLTLVASYRDRYAEIGYAENTIYDGMPETIAALAGAGYELGVCTSKRADYATRIIRMFNLESYFRFIDGGDIHIKKYTQLQRLVANGLQATGTIMVGDRAVDIDAARRNRIDAIGVCWGFGEIAELQAAKPDYLVRSPSELRTLFL